MAAAILCIALAGCGNGGMQADTGSAASEVSEESSYEETADSSKGSSSAEEETEKKSDPETALVNMAVLAGPTGIGASDLMGRSEEGKTLNRYQFTVASANDEVVAGLMSGELDIAAVATNVAANLYAKTNGGVKICALNTLGVLYILENGDSVQNIGDLKGRTVYATGQGANPEYVLEYLLEKNGLSWQAQDMTSEGLEGEADVRLEFMDSESLSTGAAAGEYDLVMLPVPAVTAVQLKNADMRTALDLTKEWNSLDNGGQLTMGCIVVRSSFAKENADAVKNFLEDYASSIENVKNDPETAGQLCEKYGITAKAAIAQKAIPACNLCFISGDDIRSTIEPYYEVLYKANPASIGGAMPDSDFYLS